jgi:hypothetical protein
MILPEQSRPVERVPGQAHMGRGPWERADTTWASAWAGAGDVAPSGWEECYGLTGEAQQACLTAFE